MLNLYLKKKKHKNIEMKKRKKISTKNYTMKQSNTQDTKKRLHQTEQNISAMATQKPQTTFANRIKT